MCIVVGIARSVGGRLRLRVPKVLLILRRRPIEDVLVVSNYEMQ